MKKTLVSIFLTVILSLSLFACGESEESSTVEYDTVGGYHATVSADCPLDYATAVSQSVSKIVPGADTSKLAPQDCMLTEYDNGMASITFQNVIIDGTDFGGEIYLELDGESFKTHYLQVANKEYLNDGIDLRDYDEK